MTTEKKKEFTLRISRANPTELTVILFDVLLTHLDDAKKALQNGEMDAYRLAISNARNSINVLLQSLDMNFELSVNLKKLYLYSKRLLARAEYKKDNSLIDNIISLMNPIRNAFNEVTAQDTRESSMNRGEEIFVGLTYGRKSLNEIVYEKTN